MRRTALNPRRRLPWATNGKICRWHPAWHPFHSRRIQLVPASPRGPWYGNPTRAPDPRYERRLVGHPGFAIPCPPSESLETSKRAIQRCVASAVPGPARFALQKRLQRARKFLLLVDVFGPFVLNVVPEVSVSRLDMVKLDDLLKLVGDGSNDQVASIVRKLELAEAMQVRW